MNILNQAGLTLIGLLLAVGIIALLLSIAILAFSPWVTKYDINDKV